MTKRRNVGGIKTEPKNITCLLKRKAKSRDGATYKRKYPAFHTIKQKLKSAKERFNFFWPPWVKIKINKSKFSITAQRGRIAYVFITINYF
jgi:hypothetical protein